MPLLTMLLPLFTNLLGFIPNPEDRAKKLQEIVEALQHWDNAQTQVNQAEASSKSVFVAGWRPMIGWVCALAVAYQYLGIPFATWGFAVAHVAIPDFPKLDDNLWQLTFGMLGMSGLRTFEKMQLPEKGKKK